MVIISIICTFWGLLYYFKVSIDITENDDVILWYGRNGERNKIIIWRNNIY